MQTPPLHSPSVWQEMVQTPRWQRPLWHSLALEQLAKYRRNCWQLLSESSSRPSKSPVRKAPGSNELAGSRQLVFACNGELALMDAPLGPKRHWGGWARRARPSRPILVPSRHQALDLGNRLLMGGNAR